MTPAGAPYFAMEYVDGSPLTEFCERHNLSLSQRLELFVQVCEGFSTPIKIHHPPRTSSPRTSWRTPLASPSSSTSASPSSSKPTRPTSRAPDCTP
jgi:hypothetical protein